MDSADFARVIVIGYGAITGEVLRIAYEKSKQYGYLAEYVEHEVYPFNLARKYAEASDISYRLIEDKTELYDYLLAAATDKVLIVSASNNYLFPKVLVENENVTIINFHNALLPNYPGRNAPSWAIYNDEKKTGITWHYVTDKIDDGDIIIQKECLIQPEARAYELAAELMQLAAKAFEECFADVLTNTVVAKQQDRIDNRKIYKSTEVPGNANFNLTDSPEYIYRLLRALDYGKSNIFPPASMEFDGNKIIIRRYKIINHEEKQDDAYKLYLHYGQRKLLMLRYDIRYAENAAGGVLGSIEQFYEFVAELKTYKRHLASNFYLNEDEMSSLIDDEKVFYYYKPGKYLNFWKNEWDFTRLYYYIADVDGYDIPFIVGKIVCDIFGGKRTEENNAVRCAMEKAGFRGYALFHKYEKKRDLSDVKPGSMEVKRDLSDVKPGSMEVIAGKAEGFYDLLRECFDRYTDLVPEPEKARQFFGKKICYSVVDGEGKIAGGTVITRKGSVETEEFIFVKEKWRGRGMARGIREYCHANAAGEVAQFVSWVRSDNKVSSRQLINLGYKKSNAYKITMMKG